MVEQVQRFELRHVDTYGWYVVDQTLSELNGPYETRDEAFAILQNLDAPRLWGSPASGGGIT